jgi:hypothetical protein
MEKNMDNKEVQALRGKNGGTVPTPQEIFDALKILSEAELLTHEEEGEAYRVNLTCELVDAFIKILGSQIEAAAKAATEEEFRATYRASGKN